MKYKLKSLILPLLCSLTAPVIVNAETEITGLVNIDLQVFTSDALSPEQHDNYLSMAIEPEIYHELENGNTALFKPFGRIDQHDENRSHADIRELYWQTVTDDYELRIGISKVYWGSTESQHLVDIINQTDLVESFDGEEKLGQPMIKLSFEKDWGNLDLFVLPYFRERIFAGAEGRLRPELIVDDSLTQYESSDEENNIDIALRFFKTIEDWDIGLSYFDGTSRNPNLIPTFNTSSELVLVPFYAQIQQIGLDVTGTVEDWIWKAEIIGRKSNNDTYTALTAGYEYTFYGIYETATDLGIVNEYLFDDRGDNAATPFQNDIMLGLRFSLNNEQSTEALIGFIIDADNQSQIFSIEASQRIGDDIKIELEARLFSNIDQNDITYNYRNDDHIKVGLSYFY